ncbi:hypothetical protein KIW84_032892 [Lathyrus oleraceus]|uniref:Retrovirus-related Pol polyprotein from transposon TNT 1-94-like beta-barrel domain-containing protein n=1 Tax=Pisum sativum TaxID=3888 RepID=A0A9D5B2G7_PEA|nr:hypothetical protein KIW84_032892 [Pisum sativum]
MASTGNSSTVYNNAKVPLFEGENYDFWAIKMETLFTFLDVLEFIQNGYEEPAPTEAEESNEKAEGSSQQFDELKKKKITYAGVVGMIQRAISISIFLRIMREKTSKEAWNILQQEFEGDSKRFCHIQKDCCFANQQHASFVERENDEGNLFFACQKAFQEDKNVWYLYSGCSNHMTGKKEAFINIDSSFGLKVKLGNGEHVEVKGKDSIGVTTKQGSKFIHDTLYVPKLDENLLSIGQLLEHGYSLNFENRECRIFDSKKRNVVVIKMTSNKSFPLSLNYEKKSA